MNELKLNNLNHTAPLRELVARLHAGKSLRERVVKLRWRRKKPAAVEKTDPYGHPEIPNDLIVGPPCDNPYCDCNYGQTATLPAAVEESKA